MPVPGEPSGPGSRPSPQASGAWPSSPGAGLSNAEIATRLFITVKTTEHHLAAIYRKLNISSRHQLPDVLAGEHASHTEKSSVGAPSDAV